MYNVLFLDIDGVLNSVSSVVYWMNKTQMYRKKLTENFCPIARSNLKFLIKKVPNIAIVVSSAWRNTYTMEQLKVVFEENMMSGLNIIDVTGNGGGRPDQIAAWIEGNKDKVAEYAIVDDYDHGGLNDRFGDKFVLIDNTVGFTINDAEKVFRIFNGFGAKFAPKVVF